VFRQKVKSLLDSVDSNDPDGQTPSSKMCDEFGHPSWDKTAHDRGRPKARLSQQEVKDALAHHISFGVDDVTIVDWNAALSVDREGDDVRPVLEFANVELLELRYLDRTLDDALDRSYEALTMPQRSSVLGLGVFGADRHRAARMQVESVIPFEGVNNTLKLLGDQYLSRVYRLVSQRLHLAEWDAGILRKLQALESIYEKMSDQATTRRMEVLEWIIIILIAISIILPFLPGGYGR
jgi:hypothetical protein